MYFLSLKIDRQSKSVIKKNDFTGGGCVNAVVVVIVVI